MAITNISRDYGVNVSIVRLTSTDNTAACLAAGYILAQDANIAAVNNGEIGNSFSWFTNDCVLLSASDGLSFCSISPTFQSLIPLSAGAIGTSLTLTAAQFNALASAPQLIIPAIGPNLLITLEKAYVTMVYNSAAPTSGGAMAFQYESTITGGGTPASNSVAAATFTGLSASETITFNTAATIPLAAAVNQPIYLSNATANFASFNGSVIIDAFYKFMLV